MNEEIKPCPFCGNEGDYNDFLEIVICVNPKCNSYGPDGENESNSIQKWNQRPYDFDMPAIVRKVQQLEKENEQLKAMLQLGVNYANS